MDWVIHLSHVKWNEPNPSNRIRVTCKKGVFSNLTLGQLLSKEPSIDATLLPPTKRKNSAYTGGGKVGKLIFIADAYLTKPLATRSLFSRDVWMAIMAEGCCGLVLGAALLWVTLNEASCLWQHNRTWYGHSSAFGLGLRLYPTWLSPAEVPSVYYLLFLSSVFYWVLWKMTKIEEKALCSGYPNVAPGMHMPLNLKEVLILFGVPRY